MKAFAILILVLICSIGVAQTNYKYTYKQGYQFIHQAQKKLRHGNLVKAYKFANKAKQADYGFCGNAWAEAHSQINFVEVQILIKQNKYDEALTVLDSLNGCRFGTDCGARDSIKVGILFLKFGEEKVKLAFKKITEVIFPNDFFGDNECLAYLADLNYKFWFVAEHAIFVDGKRITYVNGQIVEIPKTDHEFYDLAKNQPFYKLIQ